METFVLVIGGYRPRNILVTSNVKKVCRKYVDLMEIWGEHYHDSDRPYIEVWLEEDENYPTSEVMDMTTNERQLVKYVSKLARGIK